nr:immunoglobulin heavy chain junction region [Macaca mulatta]MOX66129.1 immunoglobulin heavy chain junction region [Macaca mulatta]MOX66838.1 immunoglobulin heavy chain junction region [Macaca mulatta]MOX67478.1 immunoglobulin heavy chain junction region [Macaca mulatta]
CARRWAGYGLDSW